MLSVDSNEDFVQVPNIAEAARTPIEFLGIVGTELLTPASDCFLRDDDSAFGEKIFDVSEAQAETMLTQTALEYRTPSEFAELCLSYEPTSGSCNVTIPSRGPK